MTGDRWRSIERIFGEAIERPTDERAEFVETACQGDTALRTEVESLLAAHEEDTFLKVLPVPTGVADSLLSPTEGVVRETVVETDQADSPDWEQPTHVPARRDSPLTRAPERLGPYEILSTLGRGGMGIVYRGRHGETGRLAAVKTVAVPNQSLLANFRREIHALACLDHPGIVRILDEGVHEGLPWYAMEILDGSSLRRHTLGETVGGLASVLTLVRRLCSPLAFLHGEGIVHRDLKPDNVLVLGSGQPVLVDFGLASFFAGTEGREALDVIQGGGTLAYMAPEQIRNEPLDARADLYALGCVLYELLTGRPPFLGETADDFVQAHLETVPAPPSKLVAGLPPALDDLVLRLLAKRPADRVGHAGAVAGALARLGADGPISSDGPRPRAYLYRAGFAGREDALADVERRLTALVAGAGGMVLVEGESGVGKTRLALQVAHAATLAGARVLDGECSLRATPLEALRKPLRSIADRCRERGERETRRMLGPRGRLLAVYEPSLGGLPGQEKYPEPAELSASAARLRLFSYLAETFGALAEARPVVLILDDLQWADELTLGWLGYLLRSGSLDRSRILVFGTYRSEEAGKPLHDLAESPLAARLYLDRLEEEAVAAMVGDMLGLTPPPPVLSRFLSEQSEGNPFFVAEYLRAAVEGGMLWRDEEGGWQVAERSETRASVGDYEGLGLPRSLRALVERRLEGLPEQAATAVVAAAVVGREVSPAILESATGLGDVALFEATEELLRRRVLEETKSGRLRFAHDKLREVAYGGLEPERRARLHRSVAEALEGIGASREHPPASLGHHWEQAGEPERAVEYYLSGARDAKARFANAESIRLYRAYLALVNEPTAESIAARNELGTMLRIRGSLAEAIDEHDRAREDAGRRGDRAVEGESLEYAGAAYITMGKTSEALAVFDRALALAREVGDRRREAGAIAGLASTHATRGAFDQAHPYFDQALALYQATGDRRGEAITLRNLGTGLVTQGCFDEGRECLERALTISREIGARQAEALTLCGLADIRSGQGQLAEARSLFEQTLPLIREIGDRQFEGIALVNLATICADEGRVDEAGPLYEQALAMTRSIGDRRGEGFVLIDRATLERRVGDLDEGRRLFGAAEALFSIIGDRLYMGLCACGLGHVALARNEPAATHLETVRAISVEIGAGPGSRLERAGAQLERAIAASERGEPLHRGECADDIPVGLRRRLSEADARLE